MAHGHDVIENPARRERVTMLQTTGDGFDVLRMRIEQEPTTAKPPLHVHPHAVERLTVEHGTLSYRLGGAGVRTAAAGEQVVVPAATAHTWWNDGPESLLMVAELEPGGRFETFLETIYGLTRDGKTRNGRPHPLQAAVIFQEFHEDFMLAGPPRLLLRLLLPLLARLGRARGYRAVYPAYTSVGERANAGERA